MTLVQNSMENRNAFLIFHHGRAATAQLHQFQSRQQILTVSDYSIGHRHVWINFTFHHSQRSLNSGERNSPYVWAYQKGTPFNYWDDSFQKLISDLRPGVVMSSRKDWQEIIAMKSSRRK